MIYQTKLTDLLDSTKSKTLNQSIEWVRIKVFYQYLFYGTPCIRYIRLVFFYGTPCIRYIRLVFLWDTLYTDTSGLFLYGTPCIRYTLYKHLNTNSWLKVSGKVSAVEQKFWLQIAWIGRMATDKIYSCKAIFTASISPAKSCLLTPKPSDSLIILETAQDTVVTIIVTV